jgi:hypothetical protein
MVRLTDCDPPDIARAPGQAFKVISKRTVLPVGLELDL